MLDLIEAAKAVLDGHYNEATEYGDAGRAWDRGCQCEIHEAHRRLARALLAEGVKLADAAP